MSIKCKPSRIEAVIFIWVSCSSKCKVWTQPNDPAILLEKLRLFLYKKIKLEFYWQLIQ